MSEFLRILRAETIKLKYSGVFWLATAGTLFTNLMLAILPFNMPVLSEYLGMLPLRSWEGWFRFHYLGILPMLLPMFLVILCALSLLMENRSRSWKLLYTLPTSRTNIYLSKLLVLTLVFALSHMLFTILMVLIPPVVGHSFEAGNPLSLGLVLKLSGGTILSCLGILGLVYFISYFSRSFVLPLAVGILGFVMAQLIADYGLDGAYFPFSWPSEVLTAIYKNESVWQTVLASTLFGALITLLGMWLARRDRTKTF